jgi:hypothetical protein
MLWNQVYQHYTPGSSQPATAIFLENLQASHFSFFSNIHFTDYDSWTSDLAPSQPRDHLDHISNNYRDPSKVHGPGMFHHESLPIFFLQTIGEVEYAGRCLVEAVAMTSVANFSC